jgi:hypothetical protein
VRRFALLPVLLATLLGAPPAHAWTWPLDGPVLKPFQFGSDPYAAGSHRGLDVAGPTGTRVLAPASGSVSFAGTVPGGGRTITIQTADGYAVTLLHLGTIGVTRGASVAEGSAVGTAGTSGDPEHGVPYVHLGIRVASDPQGYLDPLAFLPARTTAPPASEAPFPGAEPPAGPPDAPAPGAAHEEPLPGEPPADVGPAPEPAAGPEAEVPAGDPVVEIPAPEPATGVPAAPPVEPSVPADQPGQPALPVPPAPASASPDLVRNRDGITIQLEAVPGTAGPEGAPAPGVAAQPVAGETAPADGRPEEAGNRRPKERRSAAEAEPGANGRPAPGSEALAGQRLPATAEVTPEATSAPTREAGKDAAGVLGAGLAALGGLVFAGLIWLRRRRPVRVLPGPVTSLGDPRQAHVRVAANDSARDAGTSPGSMDEVALPTLLGPAPEQSGSRRLHLRHSPRGTHARAGGCNRSSGRPEPSRGGSRSRRSRSHARTRSRR